MSTILDALRKLQRDREGMKSPATLRESIVKELHVPPVRRVSWVWIALGVVTTLSSGTLVALLLLRSGPTPLARRLALAPTALAESRPEPAVAARPAAPDRETLPSRQGVRLSVPPRGRRAPPPPVLARAPEGTGARPRRLKALQPTSVPVTRQPGMPRQPGQARVTPTVRPAPAAGVASSPKPAVPAPPSRPKAGADAVKILAAAAKPDVRPAPAVVIPAVSSQASVLPRPRVAARPDPEPQSPVVKSPPSRTPAAARPKLSAQARAVPTLEPRAVPAPEPRAVPPPTQPSTEAKSRGELAPEPQSTDFNPFMESFEPVTRIQRVEPTRAKAASSATEVEPTGEDPPGSGFPRLALESVRWHPDPSRRLAEMVVDHARGVEVREGDIVQGALVEKIEPAAVELRVGTALKRLELGP